MFINSPDVELNNKFVRLYTVPDNDDINRYTYDYVENFEPVTGQKLFVQNGTFYRYLEMTYNGTEWYVGQNKTKHNQQPLFVIYDYKGVRLDDTTAYPDSDFRGNTIFEYAKIGRAHV